MKQLVPVQESVLQSPEQGGGLYAESSWADLPHSS
jgi:hypothetical protein